MVYERPFIGVCSALTTCNAGMCLDNNHLQISARRRLLACKFDSSMIRDIRLNKTEPIGTSKNSIAPRKAALSAIMFSKHEIVTGYRLTRLTKSTELMFIMRLRKLSKLNRKGVMSKSTNASWACGGYQ